MIRILLVLIALVGAGPLLVAQEGAPQSGKPSRPRTGRLGPSSRQAQGDDALARWVRVCCLRSLDRNPLIRMSARAAILALGEAAVPTLERIAEEPRRLPARRARELTRQIRRAAAPKPDGPGSPRARQRLMEFRQRVRALSLKPAERRALQLAQRTRRDRTQAVRRRVLDGAMSQAEARGALERIRREHEAEMARILGPERASRWREMQGRLGRWRRRR
jgi:hypothetical protein